jgi:hypothetical protein
MEANDNEKMALFRYQTILPLLDVNACNKARTFAAEAFETNSNSAEMS